MLSRSKMLLNPKKWIVSRFCPGIAPSKWKHLKSRLTDNRKEKKQSEKTEKKCKRGIVKGCAAMWWCLTVGFTVRSEKAVEAGARGTGQALCVGALLLPCLLSSLLQSHDAPAALSAIDQSECKRGPQHSGATSKTQSGERLKAWCWHTTDTHMRARQWEREKVRDGMSV